MIALITPTGARPYQFKICEKLMHRQTYKGDVAWIIVDDSIPVSTDNVKDDFRKGWTIIKEYPKPLWRQELNTQGRNISVGINTLMKNYYAGEIEAIFIIEDDDYYRPVYLEKMMPQIQGYHAAGEMNTIYYNVYFRRYITNNNRHHVSLFQVAFSVEEVPTFRMCLQQKFIDAEFFKRLNKEEINIFKDINLAVGTKGMPGRHGIGAGHSKAMNMKADFNMVYLKSLIGTKDAEIYERYYGGNG